MRRVRLVSFGIALASAALVGLSTVLPLWTLTMKAPQYPKGLRLEAYGTTMVGDLRELNILNHYIGMQPIAMPPLETALYPIGILALVTMCLAAPLHRYLRRLATAPDPKQLGGRLFFAVSQSPDARGQPGLGFRHRHRAVVVAMHG